MYKPGSIIEVRYLEHWGVRLRQSLEHAGFPAQGDTQLSSSGMQSALNRLGLDLKLVGDLSVRQVLVVEHPRRCAFGFGQFLYGS